jgi:hypothetical protein
MFAIASDHFGDDFMKGNGPTVAFFKLAVTTK